MWLQRSAAGGNVTRLVGLRKTILCRHHGSASTIGPSSSERSFFAMDERQIPATETLEDKPPPVRPCHIDYYESICTSRYAA